MSGNWFCERKVRAGVPSAITFVHIPSLIDVNHSFQPLTWLLTRPALLCTALEDLLRTAAALPAYRLLTPIR